MAVKIIVVDDEPDVEALIRQKYRRQIREKRYEFVFASNGVEALNKIQDIPDIDIILAAELEYDNQFARLCEYFIIKIRSRSIGELY